MKRPNLMKVCAGALFVIVGGCSRPARQVLHSPSLLFDPMPGAFSAQQLSGRDPWPIAESSFHDGENAYYEERFHDYLGDGYYGRDYFRRRFTAVRKGSSHR